MIEKDDGNNVWSLLYDVFMFVSFDTKIVKDLMSMKRIKYLSFCCMTAIFLTACSKITVKSENGTEYESYQECCSAQDFQAAHQYLAKLENSMGDSYDKKKEYEAAREYVFKQEALYLMSIGDETAKKRIIYLLKEEGNNNERVDMLIDLAVDNDDVDFAKTLVNQLSGSVDSDIYKKIYQYFSEKGLNEHKDFLVGVFKKNNAKKMLLEIAFDTDDMKLLHDYTSEISLYDSEIIKKIAQKKMNSLSDFVLSLLTQEFSTSVNRPSLGVTSYFWATDKQKFIDECERYESYIKSYNQKCLQITEIGIECKNLYLSRGAIKRMKSNITHKELATKNDYYRISVSAGDKSDITAANKVLNDAINRKAFR